MTTQDEVELDDLLNQFMAHQSQLHSAQVVAYEQCMKMAECIAKLSTLVDRKKLENALANCGLNSAGIDIYTGIAQTGTVTLPPKTDSIQLHNVSTTLN